MEKNKIKNIFLENLPRCRVGKFKTDGEIDWKNSLGYIVYFIHDNIKGEIEIVDYTFKGQRLKIKYNNKYFDISTGNFVRCKFGKILNKKTSEFKIEIGTRFLDEKRDLIIIDREYRLKEKISKLGKRSVIKEKWYKYCCNKDGNIDWMIESNLLAERGCSACFGTPVLGINTIWDTDRWMCDLGISEEDAKTHTHGSNDKIQVICPDCGKKKNIIINNIYKRHTISCSCSDGKSYLSKYICNFLTQLDIDFETEVKYEWNKYKTFDNTEHQASIDFVIEYKGRYIALEADGEFHRKDNKMSGQTKEESEYIDSQRDNNCLKYLKEKTIRISDEGDIKQNIIDSNLDKLFDLSNVNWNKCGEFALSNLVKIACDIKKSNTELTATDISRSMGYSYGTVGRWLKEGQIHGWCEYDTTKIMKENGYKTSLLKNKPIICIENKKIFKSGTYCSNISLDIFGVKLNQSKISQVCLNKMKQTKGFTFKYIADLTPDEYIKFDIENKLKEIQENAQLNKII